MRMQVDPANVSVSDIRRYERLMSGQSVRAISNANSEATVHPSRLNVFTSRNFRTKHHWTFNESPTEPLVMEFERSTSLISLNI